MTFPYMELQNLWDQWNTNFVPNTAPAQAIEGLTCPSDPPEILGQPWLTYVGNAGWAFSDPTRDSPDEDAITAPMPPDLEFAANGVFFDNAKNSHGTVINTAAVDGREGDPPIQMTLSYIQSNDGQSKTLWISENVHAWYWCYGITQDPTDAYTAQDDESTMRDGKHLFGFVWSNDPTPIERINGDKFSDRTPPPDSMEQFSENMPGVAPVGSEYESYGYPTSKHPGGVNAAFCDGHIVFIQENIDPRIYAMLMTSNQKRSKFYDRNVTPANMSADRFLQQPSDEDY
jgi:prepilin-type processing-associated H-X9-DG protein